MLYVQPVSPEFTRPIDFRGENQAAREAAALREFEHVFLYTLLGEMRKTIDEGGLFELSGGMAMFEDMMDDAIAQQMAQSGQMGIAKAIEEQLRVQEVQDKLLNSATSP